MTVKPIKPSEVTKVKASAIPPKVIEAFNELIAENWDGSSARVTQDEAVKRIMKKLKLKKREIVFDKSYLDVEPVFEEAGWSVKFDKPGYCESYEAYYVFSE